MSEDHEGMKEPICPGSNNCPLVSPLVSRVETLERQHRSFILEMAAFHAELRSLREEINRQLGAFGGEMVHVIDYLRRIETKLNTAIGNS